MGITYTNELPNGIKQGYDYDTEEKMVSIPDNGEFLITSRKKVNAYKELIKNSREQPSYTCSNMDSIKKK
ncbi:hypothetical protein [Halalkalibacterium ligniniphilum]|uniref:hypothetical protein n=1 Tax=Halalkalibacterium ligniniphilum TaxID=1134413 RepID=UPI00034CD7D4|nr:hypothetical protein [Halalkalibacterium ligniniphilum]